MARRQDLLARLTKETAFRAVRVRRTVGRMVPDREYKDALVASLATGYLRALAHRFAAQRGLDHGWWVEARRQAGLHGKDRSQDVGLLRTAYPEFDDFVVDVTDEEVLEAAKVEFRDALSAPGTVYHQVEQERRHQDFGALNVVSTATIASARNGEEHIDIVDTEAVRRIEDVVALELWNSEEDPWGPLTTRIAHIALEEFGTGAVFWLVECMFLPGQWADVIRVVAGNEDEIGADEVERLRRDFIRKAPVIEQRVKERLKDDPVATRLLASWQDLHEYGSTPKERKPQMPQPGTSVVQQERERFITKYTERLSTRLFAASEMRLLRVFETRDDATRYELLHEFREYDDDAKFPVFVEKLRRTFRHIP